MLLSELPFDAFDALDKIWYVPTTNPDNETLLVTTKLFVCVDALD